MESWMRYDGYIDLLVGVYTCTLDIEDQVNKFLENLQSICNLDKVNVTCVERLHQPISTKLRSRITELGFSLFGCPLPSQSSCREDTGQFCDWMMDNVGDAPWVCISHFDIVMLSDYISLVRIAMQKVSMIGNHYDGIMCISREAYDLCRVGFCGVEHLCVARASSSFKLRSTKSTELEQHAGLDSLDVGELLPLRLATLGLKHVASETGAFLHSKNGSGHL